MKIQLGLLILVMSAGGCSMSDNKTAANPMNNELYDGKPTLSLSNDFPPQTVEEAILRGDKALRERDLDLALYEYIRALTFPGNEMSAPLYHKIGLIHQQKGNTELAILAFKRAIEHDPGHITSFAALGVLELKAGKREAARNNLSQAIALDQHRLNNDEAVDLRSRLQLDKLKMDVHSPIGAYNALAVIHDMEADNNTAQQIYQQILSINPKWVYTLINLGYSYYLSNDLPQAEFYTYKASSIALNNPRIWSNLSLIYAKQKKYTQALDALTRVQKREEALNDIGYFAMISGDYEAAIHYLQLAIDEKPSFYEKAQNNLERAKRLQMEHPPIKIAGKWQGDKPQATVFELNDTTHE